MIENIEVVEAQERPISKVLGGYITSDVDPWTFDDCTVVTLTIETSSLGNDTFGYRVMDALTQLSDTEDVIDFANGKCVCLYLWSVYRVHAFCRKFRVLHLTADAVKDRNKQWKILTVLDVYLFGISGAHLQELRASLTRYRYLIPVDRRRSHSTTDV